MHPDLPHEQAYFDRALALRDRQHADLARSPGLAAHPRAAVELRRRVSGLGLADPDEAVAFGRIDAGNGRWYIGKGAIWGDDNDLVVVNWQAPIAAPFYTATPDDPEGLEARRLYRCSGNQIREIEDLMFREVSEAIANGREPAEPVLTDALLDALGSARSGELGDIVATIQGAQYDVISRELDQLLVVQGGPGTGKTVVGLHRVSWLLFNRRARLEGRDVLVVGPNPAFVHYVSSVLPSLGDASVVQLPLRALGPHVRIGRVDPSELRRLKGDRRMLRLILRGLRHRQRIEAVPVELSVAGRRVELDGRRIATRARQLAGRPHNEGYRMLRAFVIAEAAAALAGAGTGAGSRAPGAAGVAIQGESARDIDNYLDRAWPSLTPQGFLVELLSSRRQLLAAGAGSLSEAELDLLALPTDARVSSWQWSVDDVPLLDTADALLNGVAATYEHIVVDEAQDLSPLQLESIRRRSRAGSMTVLGDLAQGTSPWAHESWDSIVQALRHERVSAELVELEYGYRLPAEVHEVAMRLLSDTAPGLSCPVALRASGHEVVVAPASGPDDLAAEAVATVVELAGDGIVGVITPASVRAGLVAALDLRGVAWAPELRAAAAPVVVLTPDEAKGLEFDVVVVVEPAAIVEESEHGLRSLFVALTRCTNRLALVHARPLPSELGLGPSQGDGATAPPEGVDDLIDDHSDAAEPSDVGEDTVAMPVIGDDLPDVGGDLPDVGDDLPDVGDDAPVVGPVGPARAAERSVAGHLGSALGDAGGVDGVTRLDSDASVDGATTAERDTRVDGAATMAGGAKVEGDATAGGDATAPMSVDTTLDALDGIDHDVARAIAGAVVERLAHLVTPEMLPLVAGELAAALEARAAAADARPHNGVHAP